MTITERRASFGAKLEKLLSEGGAVKPGPPQNPLGKAGDLAKKAKLLIPTRPGISSPEKNAATRHAQETLKRLGESRVAETPVGQALRGYIQSQIAMGEGLEELEEELFARAKAEVEKRKHLVAGLQRIGRRFFTGPDKLRRLSFEVLQPAKRGQLSSYMAWQRLDDIAFGRPTKSAAQRSVHTESARTTTHTQTAEEEEYRHQKKKNSNNFTPIQDAKATLALVQAIEAEFGPIYFAVNVKASAGAGVGAGVSYGIGGTRHGQTFFQTTHSVGIGKVEVDAAGELEIIPSVWNGAPKSEAKVTFEVAGSAAWGGGAGFTVSVVPTLSKRAKLRTDEAIAFVAGDKKAFFDAHERKKADEVKLATARRKAAIGFVTGDKKKFLDAHETVKSHTAIGPGGIFDYEFDGLKFAIGVGVGFAASMSIAFGTTDVLGDKTFDWPNPP